MLEINPYLKHLIGFDDLKNNSKKLAFINEFFADKNISDATKIILENQKLIMDKWTIKNRVNDIVIQQFNIPNATINKDYETRIDFQQLNWLDLTFFEIEGLSEVGLSFQKQTGLIKGKPTKSGDVKLKLKFRVEGEPESSLNEKVITFIINPDPRALWQNKKSDTTDPYWKEDNVSEIGTLGEKNIVVSSKRGRSHANVGSFRDDDFSYKHFENNGWSLVVVADGAGGSKLGRQGARIACKSTIEYFSQNLTPQVSNEFDQLLKEYSNGSGADTQKKLNQTVYQNLGNAAIHVHKELEKFAAGIKVPLSDLNSTLIFTLFKKYTFGYAIFTFSVGDCPIGLLTKDVSQIHTMNWLDVGEFSGGTRFITMPEIFTGDKFATRFNFKLVNDFSYLVLMTDGIYDPKFSTESNLLKMETWKNFLADLNGNNPEGVKVVFDKSNKDAAMQLSTWMDFWSPGNHDDRTLAIIF